LFDPNTFVFFFICSCTSLFVRKVDTDFEGLNAAFQRTIHAGGTLRILTVHGMCHHEPGYSWSLIFNLAKRLTAEKIGAPEINFVKSEGLEYGQVRKTELKANGPGTGRIVVYEAWWSPTTDYLKRAKFANDRSFAPDRVLVNRELKTVLMDDCLADVVLYVGQYRDHMQLPVKQAVKEVLRDFDSRDEFALITESLGSYMTFDTLRSMSRGDSIMGERDWSQSAVDSLLGHTNNIYMLADQLPMLELSEVGGVNPEKYKPTHSIQDLARTRYEFVRRNRPEIAKELLPLHVVAFSDPNDLLSYPVDTSDVSNGIAFSNAIVSVERNAILGVFAWPITAHTGHDKSNEVLDLMAFGYKHRR
jgi:hypothetical protein